MNTRAVILLFLVLIIPREAAAQQKVERIGKWDHLHDSLSFAAYDPESGSLLECSRNGYRIYNQQSGPGNYVPVKNLGSYFAHFVFPVKGSGGREWIMINDMGGRTFRLSDNTISRLDSNSITRMAVTMQPFIWRDTIFSHGGYGFWSAREYVTWFDRPSGAWRVHKPVNTQELAPGILNHWSHRAGDSLFVFGGHVLDPYDPITHLLNTDLWRYDLTARTWQHLGEINKELAMIRSGQVTLKVGDKLLLYPVNKMVAEIDFRGGSIRYFKPTAVIEDLYKHGHPTTARGFFEDDTFTYCRYLDNREGFNPPHRSEWISVPRSALYGEPAGEENLLAPDYTWCWFLIIPVVIGGIVLGKKFSRLADRSIQVVSDGFVVNGSHYPAPPEAVAVVNLLLASEGPVSNAAVMELFVNSATDYSHSIRLKNQMVEKTNILLKSILNVEEDVITSERSPEDKRARIYLIRREVFRV
ncbi:MAG: hypothetical protein ACKOYP_12955 [Bacteroidota bacterium]